MKKIYKNLENFNSFIPNLSFFFSSNFLTQLSSLIIILLFARNYSSEEFGKFTIAQTVFFLVYSISFSNIHYYLNKSLSQNFQNRRKEIASCFLITFYASIFLYTLLALTLNFFSLDQDLKYLILIINFILIVEPFSIFYSEIFVRGKFRLIFKIKFFQNIIFFILKYFCIKYNYSFLYLGLLYMLEYLFFAIMMIYFYKKNGNNFSNLIFDKKETLKILKKVSLLPILSLMFLVSIRVDVLMIGMILGVEYSGYYSASSRLVIVVSLYSTLFLQFLYPNISRLSVKSDKFDNIYKNLIAFAALGGLSFFIFSYLIADFYLSLFGKNFFIAKDALLILSINVSFATIYNIWVHKNFLTNNYFKIFYFHITIIFLNIVINFYMIDLYGIKGAAISTLISGVFSFFIINISNPKEIYLIFSSLKFERFNIIANNIFSIILLKKKPDSIEKIDS